jgi:hypothetical protein
VCSRADEASKASVKRLLELSADPAWSSALGTAEMCLDDIYALWTAAAAGSKEAAGRWAAILTVQRKRLEALQKTLADYAHNSTADRRHLITPEQKEAGAASIRLFGGTPDRDRTR